jgi:hypothetical protein
MSHLKLLKKGILDEFQSDVLTIPWTVRRQLLEPIEELYEDDPEATREDIYRALFYFVYGATQEPNPTSEVFKRFEVYRSKWKDIEIMGYNISP